MPSDVRYDGDGGTGASEDTSAAREHVREAAQNRDALAASTPSAATPGPSAASEERSAPPRSSARSEGEDTSGAEAHTREAARNRDALEAENRRIRATEPPELRDP